MGDDMRRGLNPNRGVILPSPARVVVLVITHLPEMESAYHARRLEVMRHSFTTLFNNINMEHNLIVWDNDSDRDVQEWLQGVPADTFIFSRNIGKVNALKSVMRMLPPDTILAYGDDDIEYMPNWLEPQIKILETYPSVGTVTGWPVRLTGKWGVESALHYWDVKQGHKPEAEIEQGRFIPDEWERDYCESIGRDYHGYVAATSQLQDYRITYKGVQAYAMGQHCQFVCYPSRVEPLLQWTSKAMQEEIPFDKAVDAAGLLRLATVERYTRHIGNVLE